MSTITFFTVEPHAKMGDRLAAKDTVGAQLHAMGDADIQGVCPAWASRDTGRKRGHVPRALWGVGGCVHGKW